MLHQLKSKTALITGGAKRIGREMALILAGRGINVVIHFNRSDSDALQLAGELKQKGVEAWTIQADFRRPDEYQTLIERALQIGGGLDILINNASIFPAEKLKDLTWSGFVANMEVNAWVPFGLSRTFAERINRGNIVNLHDSRLRGYDWTHVGYILSKHVLAAMTRMMALEFAPGITVNAGPASTCSSPDPQHWRPSSQNRRRFKTTMRPHPRWRLDFGCARCRPPTSGE
jgi:pteridine reductase